MGSLNAGMENDRACGLATIMGIGKAVPEHVVPQKSFPDFYFEISNSNHMVELKTKFAKICKWKHACMRFILPAVCIYLGKIYQILHWFIRLDCTYI